MPTVLGKRARAAESSKGLQHNVYTATARSDACLDESSISSRVKRRAQIPFANDENVDPLYAHYGREHDELNSSGLDASEVSMLSPKSLSQIKRAVGQGKRVALSPRKANGQGRASSEITGMFSSL